MKKLLSVIAAVSVAMTAFASLTITASAKDYNGKDLKVGDILYPGDTITLTGGKEEDPVLYLDYQDAPEWLCCGEESFTLPNDYKWYKIVEHEYEEEHEDEDDPEFIWGEECVISFVTNVTSVSFDKQELTLAPGSTGNLITHVEPDWAENKNYTLSSSDPSVATVDDGGTVTAKAVGTATITATSQDDNTIVGTCTVTVPCAEVTINDVTTPYANFATAAAAWAAADKAALTLLGDYELTKEFTVPSDHILNIPEGVSVSGTGSIDNKGMININGTLDSSKGTIVDAGDVNVSSKGNLIIATGLPATGNVTVYAGGKISVSTDAGTAPFIGETNNVTIQAIGRGATLDSGSITFALAADTDTYTLNGNMTVYGWDTANAMFGDATKALVNNGTMNIPATGAMVIGSNTTLTNNSTINVDGTINAAAGHIADAGTVNVSATGNLIIAPPLPAEGEITINAGGMLYVATAQGNVPFVGKSGQTMQLGVTLDDGNIKFTLSEDGNTYELNGTVDVYQWDTGNAIFGTAKKTLINKGTMNVIGSLVINNNSTLTNNGTIALAADAATVYVKEDSKGDLVVANSNGGVNANGTTVYSKFVEAAATATRKLVKEYPAVIPGEKAASLWKVTVTPGSDAITSLSVKVNDKQPKEALTDTTKFTGGSIVFGVVLNGVASDVQTFEALVNGAAVTTTVE